MATDAMDLLMAEHTTIMAADEVIRAMRESWASDPGTCEQVLREMLSFFARYSDGFHHQKEEQVLFPALRRSAEVAPRELVSELEEHHEAFRAHVATIRRALDEGDYPLAQSTLERYFSELLDHIAVENDELFVMTESLLDAEELDRVYFRFHDIDRELGTDLKRELEATLPRLRALL
jgi:hemerythrin-like domain-containing protein